MAKRKYPSELNTRTVRVNIGDWHLLMELARQHDTTVAKILHLAIIGQAKQEAVTVTPRTQIPLPIITAQFPVTTTAKAVIKSINVKLRATVAGRRSNDGTE